MGGAKERGGVQPVRCKLRPAEADVDPYLCRRCDRVFQHLQSYRAHLKEHKDFLCLVCGEGFPQKRTLTCHIGVHCDAKPFRCPLCHKTFSHKATLQDHFNVHTGAKPLRPPAPPHGDSWKSL